MVSVDTNILLDILLPDPVFMESSYSLLAHYMEIGSVIISDVVFAELATAFADESLLGAFLEDAQITVMPTTKTGLWLASRAWRDYNQNRKGSLGCSSCGHAEPYYCRKCGAEITTRQHMIADFIIGAHAMDYGGKLLSRDRGFFGKYFPDLLIRG